MSSQQNRCEHCATRIEFRTSEWPPNLQNRWVHVKGEGVIERRCFGRTTEAQPIDLMARLEESLKGSKSDR